MTYALPLPDVPPLSSSSSSLALSFPSLLRHSTLFISLSLSRWPLPFRSPCIGANYSRMGVAVTIIPFPPSSRATPQKGGWQKQGQKETMRLLRYEEKPVIYHNWFFCMSPLLSFRDTIRRVALRPVPYVALWLFFFSFPFPFWRPGT